MEGWRGGRDGGSDGGREGWREGGKNGAMEGTEGGREGWRLVHGTPSSVTAEVLVPQEPPRPSPAARGQAVKSNGAERGAAPSASLGCYQSQ